MDHTQTLPDDLLASIIRLLPPRDLAASRSVRKAWLAVVDAHGLLLPHVLPRSVRGLFFNYVDYHRPRFFARPSSQQPFNGSLSFLPRYHRHGFNTLLDHCNGLLLCHDEPRTLCVVNPATRRWDDLPWVDENANPHLAFDPVVSPHYDVFSIPRVPENAVLNSPVPNRLVKSRNLEQFSQPHGLLEQEDPAQDSMEWPPYLWRLNVFSSSTRQWQMRSFLRQGGAAGTMANARLDPLEPYPSCWGRHAGPRRRYSAYWQGSLYVHCHGAFVVRLSLSDCKYQVIKEPTDTDKPKHARFLGKSEKGVYLATLHDNYQLQTWTLTESSEQIHWVLKHHIDLEPWTIAGLRGPQVFDRSWTIGDDDVYYNYDYYDDDDDEEEEEEEEEEKEEDINVELEGEEHGEEEEDKQGEQKENNAMIMSGEHEWNSDNDNVLNVEDLDTLYSTITFLGFHPYKEVIFLGLRSLVGVAYHLKSSKDQYLGEMRAKDYHNLPTRGIYKCFPYTPCLIGDLLENA